MFTKTNFEVIISPNGDQLIRSTASNSKTIIDLNQQTGAVSLTRGL